MNRYDFCNCSDPNFRKQKRGCLRLSSANLADLGDVLLKVSVEYLVAENAHVKLVFLEQQKVIDKRQKLLDESKILLSDLEV
jgi:hypothetical protein